MCKFCKTNEDRVDIGEIWYILRKYDINEKVLEQIIHLLYDNIYDQVVSTN